MRLVLRTAREAKGLTQEQAAELIGITRLAYINIENGTSTPKLETMFSISEALGIEKTREDFENTEQEPPAKKQPRLTEQRFRLRKARKERGISQKDVAISLGIGRSTYADIESGEIKRIDPELLFGICEVLKIKATPELFEITEEESPCN